MNSHDPLKIQEELEEEGEVLAPSVAVLEEVVAFGNGVLMNWISILIKRPKGGLSALSNSSMRLPQRKESVGSGGGALCSLTLLEPSL